MSNLKLINKVLMTTLLVFSIPTFANYSKTTSKYVKDNYVALESDISFVNPSGSANMTLLRGSWTEIQYKLTFDRNTYVDNDKYEVEVPSGCLIDKNGISSRATSTINKNKVTLEYHDKSADQVGVTYTCQVADLNGTVVDANTTKITTYAKIYETMDDFKFLFFKGDRITTVRKPHGYVDGDKSEYYYLPDIPELDAATRKKEIEDWITVTYPEANGISDMSASILEYLQSTNTDIITSLTLSGIDVSDTTIDGQKYYVFHITDDFIGYVKTYRFRNNRDKIYFSNANITESRANEVLDDYLKFFYPNNEDGTASEEFIKIRTYIYDNGGIYQVIKGTGTIRGVTRGATDDEILLSENLLTFIDIFNGEEKSIEYNSQTNYTDMIYAIIDVLCLKYSYIPDTISKDTKIVSTLYALAQKIKKGEVSEYISYVVPETNIPVLIHIFNANNNIYVSAVKLSNTEPIVLTTRTSSAYYDITSIKEFIAKIDEENARSATLDDTLYHTIPDLDTILANGGTGKVTNGDFEDAITVTITNDKGDLTNQKVEITLAHTKVTNTVENPSQETTPTPETPVVDEPVVDEPAEPDETKPLEEEKVPVVEPFDGEIPNTEIGTQEPIVDTPEEITDEQTEEQEGEKQTPEKKEEQPLIKQEEEETKLEIQKEEMKD